MDTKAVVNVGEYSRKGRSRGRQAIKALDHDMRPKEKLTPGGILEVVSGRAFVFFGISHNTSDFLVDGLHWWWNQRKAEHPAISKLVVNLDNGPDCSGRRTQFLLRLVQFADQSGLEIRLIYYPPYHSKYNRIERYWAGLEKSWNGYLLDAVASVVHRAGNFVSNGIRTTVSLFTSCYPKGVKVKGIKKKELEQRLNRSESLRWWDISIQPQSVSQ